MKKTFTKDEFESLTQQIIIDSMKSAEDKGMSAGALMTYIMTYVVAFGELRDKLFENETDTIEFEKEIL